MDFIWTSLRSQLLLSIFFYYLQPFLLNHHQQSLLTLHVVFRAALQLFNLTGCLSASLKSIVFKLKPKAVMIELFWELLSFSSFAASFGANLNSLSFFLSCFCFCNETSTPEFYTYPRSFSFTPYSKCYWDWFAFGWHMQCSVGFLKFCR